MKLSKMFLTKKFFTLLALLFFSIAAFSQSATINLNDHAPATTPSVNSAFEWHSTATPNSLDKLSVTAITAATTSTNYGVYYDVTSDCYSPAAKVDVKISACGATSVDLTAYQASFNAVGTLEWHTNSAGTAKVTDPSAVTGGPGVTYFLFDNTGTLTRLNEVVIVSIIPVPSAPTASATLQPTCSVATGTIKVTGPTETGMSYSIDGSTYTNTDGIFTFIATGLYSVTAKNAVGCVSSTSSVTINAQPATPSAPTASLTQPTCSTATGTITVNTPANGAGVTYTVTGTAPVVAAVSNSTGTFSGLAAGIYDVTTSLATDPNTCISPATSVTINAQPATPSAPAASVTAQPTCSTATGTITVTITVTGTGVTYTVTGTAPVVAAVSNSTGIFSGLATGVYSVTTSLFTSPNTCTSSAVSLTVNAQPVTPSAPIASLTQPTCTTATGTITVTTPANGVGINYTVTGTTPVVAAVSNSTGIFSGLAAGIYSVTTSLFTDPNTCISPVTSVTINAQPATPAQPTLGAVTQALCDPFGNPKGSFQITNFNNIYTYSVSPSGTVDGAGLVSVDPGTTSATFTVTATLGSCSSIASLSSGSLNPEIPKTTPIIENLVASTCYYGTATFQIKNYNTTLYNYKVISSPIGAVSSIDIAGKVTVQNGYSYSVQHQYVGGTCWSGGSTSISVNSASMNAPVLSGTGTIKNVCPVLTVNLSALFTVTVPVGNTLVWYDNNTVPPTGSAIASPAAAATGKTYYAFFQNNTNSCFASAPSTGVTAIASASCCPAGYVAPIIH
jgi:hypothetical protein